MKSLKYLFAIAVVVTAGSLMFIHMAPDKALSMAMTAARAHAGLVRKSIILPDGERLIYLEGGQGEPLMVLHGFGANKDHFVRVARELTPRYRVIIPDLLGFGESDRPAQADYHPNAQAERLHNLSAALGIRSGLHLGGSSMGGQIALAWAARYPKEVKSLWLLDPGGIWSAPKSEMLKSYETGGKMPLIVGSEEDFLNLMPWTMNKPPFAPEPLLRAMAHESMPFKQLSTRILQEIKSDSLEARIKGLQTPTLIVWGSEDRIISVETVPLLRQLLPNSKAVVMRGIGHLPTMEDPGQAGKDYLTFRAALCSGQGAFAQPTDEHHPGQGGMHQPC